MNMRNWIAVLVGFCLALPSVEVQADQDTALAHTIHSGAAARIATYWVIDPLNCTWEADPIIKVQTPPKLGTLKIARVQIDYTDECPNVLLPVTQIIYTAGPTSGTDPFTYTVTWPHSRLGTRTVTETVTVP